MAFFPSTESEQKKIVTKRILFVVQGTGKNSKKRFIMLSKGKKVIWKRIF